jgi:hypothetical protein
MTRAFVVLTIAGVAATACSGSDDDTAPEALVALGEPSLDETAASALRDVGDHPARAEIEALVARGVIKGFEDGTFRPDAPLTRAQYATIVANAFGGSMPNRRSFTDVPTTHWAYGAILRAADAGFISGYPDGTFGPDKTITRAEVVASLASGLRLTGDVWDWTVARFGDASTVPTWAMSAYGRADRAGLFDNTRLHHRGGSRLQWQDVATRGVVASYVKRALDHQDAVRLPIQIMGPPRAGLERMRAAVDAVNRNAYRSFVEIAAPTNTPKDIVDLYWEEALAEGVAPDVAFAQAMLETNYLRFGDVVRPSQNNFAGLGDVGGGPEGASFPSLRIGVRAHIQMLKAYATNDPLANPVVAPRFRFITRGLSPTLDGLNGRWAADRRYGDRVAVVLDTIRDPRASRTWLSCLTAAPRDGAFRSYITSSFKAGSSAIKVSAWRDRELDREVVLNRETDTSFRDAAGTIRVVLERRADGVSSVRVEDTARRVSIPASSGRCEEDDTDADQPACSANAVYACDTNGCGCVQSGAAPEDPWGNAIIDALAGSLAAPLRSLARAGVARIAAIENRRLLLATMNSSDQVFASRWTAVTNRAVIREYARIDKATVDALVKTTDGLPLDAFGTEIPVQSLGTGARRITLGEAQEFTERTGRELALLWDRTQRQHYVVWGRPNRLRWDVSNGRQMIWHTHPKGSPPSYADEVALAMLPMKRSFVIPADAMNRYVPEILPFRLP